MSYPFPAEPDERDELFGRFESNLKTRLKRLDRGEVIELEDDRALRAFFDDIQSRGEQRCEASKNAS